MRRLNSGSEILERFRNNRAEVEKVFEENDAVELAYVFGSVVEGDVGELSDIDFAVYLEDSVEDPTNIKMELVQELTGLVGDELDLVVMNSASALMNYNIISTGEPLYIRSRTLKAEIESRILHEYLDRRYYDKRHADKRLESFAERGLA